MQGYYKGCNECRFRFKDDCLPKCETVNPVKVILPPRKIRIDLKEFKPKNPNLPKDKKHDRPLQVGHFCGKARHTCLNCFKLQATKRANKPRVPVLQAQDLMVLIGELVNALNFYTNLGVAHHFNMNNNSKVRVASNQF